MQPENNRFHQTDRCISSHDNERHLPRTPRPSNAFQKRVCRRPFCIGRRTVSLESFTHRQERAALVDQNNRHGHLPYGIAVSRQQVPRALMSPPLG